MLKDAITIIRALFAFTYAVTRYDASNATGDAVPPLQIKIGKQHR